MEIKSITVDNPDGLNFIFGQSHFIKTVEDIYEALIQSSMSIKFGLAFCEASGRALVRSDGNDPELIDLAVRNAGNIGAGHTFFIFLKEAFPINVLPAVKQVPEVCRIFCATANPVEVIVARTGQGRGVLGVVDGVSPEGIEKEEDVIWRKEFLQQTGYKR